MTIRLLTSLPVAIAAGGALGALSRHYLAAWIMRATGLGFPYGTLAVNVLGCFALGLAAELFALKLEAPQALRAFLTVGALGGFTTFSTFSLETVLLFERHQPWAAGLYVAASLLLAVGAMVAAMSLVRWLV